MPKQSITTQVMDSLGSSLCLQSVFQSAHIMSAKLKSGKYRFVYFGLPNDAALESAFEDLV